MSWSEGIRSEKNEQVREGGGSQRVELAGLLRVNWGLTGNYKWDLILLQGRPVHWHCVMKCLGSSDVVAAVTPHPGFKVPSVRQCARGLWLGIALVLNNTTALKRFQGGKFTFMMGRLQLTDTLFQELDFILNIQEKNKIPPPPTRFHRTTKCENNVHARY